MRLRTTGLALLLTLTISTGCEQNGACPDADAGPVVSFKPVEANQDWLALPFPMDARGDSEGPNWSLFPNPFNVGLLDDYLKVAIKDVDGYSSNAAIYFKLSATLNTSGLPGPNQSAPYESLELVDIDPESSEYGRIYPVRWEYWANEQSYIPANTLAIAPHWGFPLQESTTYALLIKAGLKDTQGNLFQADQALGSILSDGGPEGCGQTMPQATYNEINGSYVMLRAYLNATSADSSSIIGASVFTTQTTSSQLALIHEQIQSNPAPAYQPDGWQTMGDGPGNFEDKSFKWTSNSTTEYFLMEGRLSVPNYQIGDVPYNRDGDLQFIDGQPTMVREETLRFTLSIPKSAPTGANGCYPIVEYAHGTGGSAYSMVPESSGRLAARGIAAIGIDMPIHGDRDGGSVFDVNMASFNFTNPDSARSMFRQAAIDTWALTRFVIESLTVDAANSPTGNAICFDTDNIGFFGHSQGGLSGALALAFEENINAWVLSGAGGGLSITVLERKDIVDFEEFIRFLVELPADEPLTELHPILTLIQTAVDITDPINYAPRWNPRRVSTPKDILVTSGCYDDQTPHRSASAMAVAGRIPLVEPAAMESSLYDLADLPYISAPVTGNLSGDGTGGFLQWCGSITQPNQSNHFVVFNRPEAIHATMQFLKTALTQTQTVIEREPSVDVR